MDIYECVIEKTRTIEYDGPEKANSYEDVYEMLKAYGLNRKAEEHFVLLTFDPLMRLTGIHEVAVGSVWDCEVNLRELFKRALVSNAANIIVAHNHVNRSACPSDGDIGLTKSILEAAKMFDIFVFDHMIVSAGSEWVSMREQEYISDIENGRI